MNTQQQIARAASLVPMLTERQREVVARVADGQTVREIALDLKLSDKTVEYHWRRIKGRLKIDCIALATRAAVKSGLVE